MFLQMIACRAEHTTGRVCASLTGSATVARTHRNGRTAQYRSVGLGHGVGIGIAVLGRTIWRILIGKSTYSDNTKLTTLRVLDGTGGGREIVQPREFGMGVRGRDQRRVDRDIDGC
jgi:hypothetical protein